MASKVQGPTFGRPLSRNSKLGCASLDSPDPATPTILADSTLISEKLVEDGVLDELNAKFSPTEKAHDLALRALLEDKLYFYQVGVPVPMLSSAHRQLDLICLQIQRLTVDYPCSLDLRTMVRELLHHAR